MIIRMNFTRRAAFLSSALLLAAASMTGAQTSAVTPSWDAWIGCWKPATAAGTPLAATSTVCVSRTAVSSAVEVATIQNGTVLTRDTIDASGQQRAVSSQGCTGWELARWSADVRRIYLQSEVTCADKIKRIGTGILAISPSGDWLDIHGVTAGGNSGVRVTHYTDAPLSLIDSLPTIAGGRATRQIATSGARTAAGSALAISAIAEAVKAVDTAVVQAWIVERGARYTLDAKQLIALADAGVPGSVTDVMIGVSYPKHFALDQRVSSALSGETELSPFDSARIASRYVTERCFGLSDPLWYTPGLFDPCRSRYGTAGYGYGLYGPRYLGYYGYSNYGYSNFGYSGYYGAPVVIVRGTETQQHGKVVKGVGYTSGSSSGTTSGASSSRSGSSGSSSGSSGSSGASSSGSSSSGSSGGRTAHPRPPE